MRNDGRSVDVFRAARRCGRASWDSTPVIGHRIVTLGTVTSTMDVAADLAKAGAAEGTIVVANEQTAGRGRGGRTWSAPAGSGLFMSLVLRPDVPPDRLGCLSLIVGVGVARTLESFGLLPKLKWPNDVWLDGRKVAGILVSSRVAAARTTVIVGIGINVCSPEEHLPPGAASLQLALNRAVTPDAVLSRVCPTLDEEYVGFVRSSGTPDLSGWTQRAALLGEPVSVVDGAAVYAGECIGIDGRGALLLRSADGRIVRIVAGDLTRGPLRDGTGN